MHPTVFTSSTGDKPRGMSKRSLAELEQLSEKMDKIDAQLYTPGVHLTFAEQHRLRTELTKLKAQYAAVRG